MKRLQISLEPALDHELERVARADGISKAAVVRRCLHAGIKPLPPIEEDPFTSVIGAFDGGDPDDAENHDETIYRR